MESNQEEYLDITNPQSDFILIKGGRPLNIMSFY